MKRYLKMYSLFMKQYLKSLLEYRLDLAIGVASFVITQMAGILFLYVVFEKIPSLNGWSFEEVLFIYGFFQIPRGIDHLFTDNIWLISRKVIRGEMDRYLLRPINPLFQLIAERFQPDAFGELITGIAILSYVIPKLNLDFTFVDFIYSVIFVFIGAGIYTSIKLIMGSISFWIKDSFPLMAMTYDMSTFTRYPISIFPKWIRFIITYIIPFAYTSYYPAAYFLGKVNAKSVLVSSSLILIVFMVVSYKLWEKGLEKYNSAGS